MNVATAITLPTAEITSAVGDVAGQVVGLVTTNIGPILTVSAVFVGLSVARNFIKRLAS